jgi:uncharacterized protein YhfF
MSLARFWVCRLVTWLARSEGEGFKSLRSVAQVCHEFFFDFSEFFS